MYAQIYLPRKNLVVIPFILIPEYHHSNAPLLSCVRVVVKNLEISRYHLADYVKEVRAARAARLFFFIQPIISFISEVVDVVVVNSLILFRMLPNVCYIERQAF